MALNDIILRSVSNPPLVTKGSALTFTELDDNFIEVYNYLLSLNNGGDLPLFDMATTYSLGDIVKYGGKIYNYISGTPASGLNPVSYPANWAETTLGVVAHLHNTDTKLAEGTADEVTAAELASLVNEQVISKTTAQFNTLVSASDLIPNRLYQITDVYSFGSVFVRSITSNKVSANGYLLMYIPDASAIVGIWQDVLFAVYAVNDYVSWDNRVYRNTTGTNTNVTPDLDTTNWALQAYSSVKYIQVLFDAVISYNGSVFSVKTFYDKRNNNLMSGLNLAGANPKVPANVGTHYNIKNVDGLAAEGSCNVLGVNNISLSKSSLSINASFAGQISLCNFINSQIRTDDTTELYITNCQFINTYLRFQSVTTSASFDNCFFQLQRVEEFNIRPTLGAWYGQKITPEGSTFVDTLDITGLTDINLSTNGTPDIYGKFILYSTNPAETIDRINNYNPITADLFPIIIQPNTGVTLTINTVAIPMLGGADFIIGNGAFPVTLIGDNYDYMVVKFVNIAGNNVWQIIEIVNN
jgi:hypothetical protein